MVINLLELFDLSVTKNGDKIAIVDGTRTISFNDLDKKSDILSQKIHNIAESVNRPVAVFLPKCIEAEFAKLLQKSEMRKDIVIELSYKGFG